MKLRAMGLVPAFAVLAGAAMAQPTNTGSVGGMAYPDSLKSGQFKVPTTATKDAGGGAYPTGTGGVALTTPPPDAGGMAYPGGGSPPTHAYRPRLRHGKTEAAAAPAPATPAATDAAPSTAPTPQGMAAARALATAPGEAAVPYVDFGPAPKSTAASSAHHAKAATKKPAA